MKSWQLDKGITHDHEQDGYTQAHINTYNMSTYIATLYNIQQPIFEHNALQCIPHIICHGHNIVKIHTHVQQLLMCNISRRVNRSQTICAMQNSQIVNIALGKT